MPRSSLKEVRRGEILDAAELCVAQFGVSGLTLEKVAEVAGLTRPLIRHNVGNREALVAAVVDRFFAQSGDRIKTLVDGLPVEQPFSALVAVLFDRGDGDSTAMLVAEALIAESARDMRIAKLMQSWLSEFVGQLTEVARQQFPQAEDGILSVVVTGVVGIYFTVDSLVPLGDVGGFNTASLDAAMLLVQQLD